MDISFEKQSNGDWVSTFTINSNCNIHLEFADNVQTLTFGLRTSGTEFDYFTRIKDHVGSYDNETDIGDVFPKDFQIISSSQVLLGIIKEAL